LRSRHWRRAIEQVPREQFLGGRVYRCIDGPGATLWEPTTPGEIGQAAWLELAYENTTWVTQLDGHDQTATGKVQGAPTSSSTLPGLVVQMLEDLDVHDGDRVLEIGTGSGYSTALLCQRLGGGLITSIEVDEGVAARAAMALRVAGHAPTLVTGDGLAGHPDNGPYDRIIATCSVRTIPDAWLTQTRPGGRILTTLSGWLYGSGLVNLEVTGGGRAEGRFLPGTVSFMPARAHAAPTLTQVPPREGESRPARYGPEILADWMGRFLAQLAAPGAQNAHLSGDEDTPPADLLIDQATGSYAWLTAKPEGAWTVIQDGPTRLWDQIEQTITAWQEASAPPQHEFVISVTPAAQTVRLNPPRVRLEWTLLVSENLPGAGGRPF
jgi:methyltransferase of ATP-grasp peptide maturase system